MQIQPGQIKMNEITLEKVTAFILRQGPDVPDLLLFEHPSAGIQVPAGTVEVGEDPQAAAFREGKEESGLSDLKLEAYLGSVNERPVIGDHFISRATTVYSRPEQTSFDWARYRRGLTVRFLRRENGFAHVSFEEPDRWPDSQYVTYQITGWVPEEVLAETALRHFYLFSHQEKTPDRWTVPIDNQLFKPFWSPMNHLPNIVAPQATWLEFLWKHLGGPR
jgi:8-oxo-dGTP pyrophosphatase MutT (NUDIX family)